MKTKKAVTVAAVLTLATVIFLTSCSTGNQKHFSQNTKGVHSKNYSKIRPAEKLDNNICFFKVRK